MGADAADVELAGGGGVDGRELRLDPDRVLERLVAAVFELDGETRSPKVRVEGAEEVELTQSVTASTAALLESGRDRAEHEQEGAAQAGVRNRPVERAVEVGAGFEVRVGKHRRGRCRASKREAEHPDAGQVETAGE